MKPQYITVIKVISWQRDWGDKPKWWHTPFLPSKIETEPHAKKKRPIFPTKKVFGTMYYVERYKRLGVRRVKDVLQ